MSILDLDNIPLGASKIAVTAHRMSQLLRSEQERALAKHGDLTLIEWRICLGLSQAESVSQKDLVRFTRMQQAQVSRALVQLESRSIIKSMSNKKDRRSKLYSLTHTGKQHLNRNRPVVVSFCEGIDNALSDSEISLYMEISERIAEVALAIEEESITDVA